MFKEGDKVTYKTPYEKEHGIVKRISDENHTFVVYHWNGNSGGFRYYTAQITRNRDLVKGWV